MGMPSGSNQGQEAQQRGIHGGFREMGGCGTDLPLHLSGLNICLTRWRFNRPVISRPLAAHNAFGLCGLRVAQGSTSLLGVKGLFLMVGAGMAG